MTKTNYIQSSGFSSDSCHWSIGKDQGLYSDNSTGEFKNAVFDDLPVGFLAIGIQIKWIRNIFLKKEKILGAA